MNIKIVAVGKLKESYWREALQEYLKRLKPFAKIDLVEIKAEPDENIDKEGKGILAAIDKRDFVVSLEVKGKRLTSPQFAKALEKWMLKGESNIVFVIGGSRGLSKEVLDRSDYGLSFSDMTFTHQMMRVFLAEQIYRAFQIMQGSRYHK